MPRLTRYDELLIHQIPEPLHHAAIHHEHWRESLFFILHPRDALGDCVILTMAAFPAREELDVLQLGHFNGVPTIARRRAGGLRRRLSGAPRPPRPRDRRRASRRPRRRPPPPSLHPPVPRAERPPRLGEAPGQRVERPPYW